MTDTKQTQGRGVMTCKCGSTVFKFEEVMEQVQFYDGKQEKPWGKQHNKLGAVPVLTGCECANCEVDCLLLAIDHGFNMIDPETMSGYGAEYIVELRTVRVADDK